MPLYHIAFVFLFVCAAIEYKKTEAPRKLFLAAFGLLTFMLCFRYAQGTDYLNYANIYSRITLDLFKAWTDDNIHGEPGWKFLNWLFKLLDLPFPFFVLILSLAEMYLFWRFIHRCCKKPMLALFLSYHTLYLTFFFSAMRQGLVIAVFIGLLLEMLEKKKYWMYFGISTACATIHSIGLLLLVLPIIQTRLFDGIKRQLLWVGLAWLFGIVIAMGVLDTVLPGILPQSVLNYYKNRGISIFAILERLIAYSVTMFCVYISTRNGKQLSAQMRLYVCIASMGMIVYGAFMWLPIVASRMSYIFKVIEIAVWSSLLCDKDVFSRLKALFCAMLVSVMYVKNIDAYIIEGNYFSTVNVLNFPYISIFGPERVNRYKGTKVTTPQDETDYPAGDDSHFGKKPVYITFGP